MCLPFIIYSLYTPAMTLQRTCIRTKTTPVAVWLAETSVLFTEVAADLPLACNIQPAYLSAYCVSFLFVLFLLQLICNKSYMYYMLRTVANFNENQLENTTKYFTNGNSQEKCVFSLCAHILISAIRENIMSKFAFATPMSIRKFQASSLNKIKLSITRQNRKPNFDSETKSKLEFRNVISKF
jgi:hypothetical protein